MGRSKIDYGIDLGTTNSAIARMDNGEVKIIKSTTVGKDTTPSCVYFKKNTILVGDAAYNRYGDEHIGAFKEYSSSGVKNSSYNSFIEFKRTMGTDKTYICKSSGKAYLSEELSAEVLKTLKNYVLDENISSIVITVPARFRNNQIDATQKASELAGFEYCELLMEPIAASIAYGVNTKNIDGHWIVFDFGGGTFDVALMKVEEGVMKVVDTDGDNHLGGKDLDDAIVDKIIIPYLKRKFHIEKLLSNNFGKESLREALKVFAEAAKIDLSNPTKTSTDIATDNPIGQDDNGEEIDFTFKISIEEYESAVEPIFLRAVNISKCMIEKNNIASENLKKILLVGGPTLSQSLRKMLFKYFGEKIDTSIDPMTCVAVGAALFASSKDIPSSYKKRSNDKIQLILKYPNNTVEDEIELGIKIDKVNSKAIIPNKIFLEIIRTDKGWSSGKVEIIDDAEILTLQLNSGKSNGFQIHLFDEFGNILKCEPNSFNIIQGFTQPNATLPMDLGIEIIDVDSNKKPLDALSGLQKNNNLPAKGKGKYKTQKDIRPGNANDKIIIPVWEGQNGTRAINNFPAGIIVITGEDFPKYLPKNSEVEISIEVDSSRSIIFKAYFPDIDETIIRKVERKDQPEYNAEDLANEIGRSNKIIDSLLIDNEDQNLITIKNDLTEIAEILENGKSDYNTKTKVMERLRLNLNELDKVEESMKLPKAEEELIRALSILNKTNQRYGNSQSNKTFIKFEELAEAAITQKNIKAMKEITEQVNSFEFTLIDEGAGVAFDISIIKDFDDNYQSINWINNNKAKELINSAKQIIMKNPTKQNLRPIIIELFNLLPESDKPHLSEKDDEFLTK